MKILFVLSVLLSVAFNDIPRSWKWLGNKEVIFSYDGSYSDSSAFSVDVRNFSVRHGVAAPEKYVKFPVRPEGAVNLTYSPDSTMLAFTRDNDLYVVRISDKKEFRLTHDGTDLILNGYASWVYYEEIFGRPSKYKAFWWSPDSRKIGFYRFDNTNVPMFPIYSPFGQNGSLNNTRYPKAGQQNPEVRVAVVSVGEICDGGDKMTLEPVWADFEITSEQYFGTPFWGKDSEGFFVSRMPRLQNTLELFRVSASDGSRQSIYKESYPTWINWMSDVVFTESGLYMVRDFETGWQQIYFLSYDGTVLKRLTDGPNWRVVIERVDEKKGDVYFTARRDVSVRTALYKVDRKGNVKVLTNPAYDVRNVKFSPDGKYYAASYSNSVTPDKIALFHSSDLMSDGKIVADRAGEDYNADDYALPQIIYLTTSEGFTLPASVVYPKNFDPDKKYPVHFDIYGGPDTPLVHDRWITPNESNQWWSENGIIQVTADCRAAGHNGRLGLDMIYRQLSVVEAKDFIEWAEYFKSLPYVNPDKIGVEGFSFGGTMTTLLVFTAPESFHYGIAGGGVYDWSLYDSHYTERYMDTPQNNPDGYASTAVLRKVKSYRTGISESITEEEADKEAPVMLKLTHGTGDDNVHFQQTLQLVNALHRAGKEFEFMIYPDGMHGYRGYQKEHFVAENRKFWLKYLK